MKILIIDDLDEKADAVMSVVNSIEGSRSATIVRQKSLASGRRDLAQVHFDLLILDLMLPVRDGGTPKGGTGADLLEEILAGDTVFKPTHVICLTSYPDLGAAVGSELGRSLLHVIPFDESSGGWRDLLKQKVGYIFERIKSAAEAPQSFLADVGIVTSSPTVELEEVLHTTGAFHGEFHRGDALHYYLDDWHRSGANPLKVVACAAPQMGMTAAAITALKMIERWRPKFLIMTGIAASTKKESNFGDILLGEMLFDYGSGKIVDAAAGRRVFVPDPRPLSIDVELKALLQKCEREQPFVGEFMRRWKGATPSWLPRITLGVLASGAAVIQSSELVKQILKTSRKVVGLDMEAYGVAHAAFLCKEPRPRVMIAKAVSDFADEKKADDWQRLAAFTSAQFVRAFVCESRELFKD